MDMRDGHAAWTYVMDMYTWMYTYTNIHVLCTRFFSQACKYIHICTYIYLYVIQVLFRFGLPSVWWNFAETKHAWNFVLWRNRKSLFLGNHTTELTEKGGLRGPYVLEIGSSLFPSFLAMTKWHNCGLSDHRWTTCHNPGRWGCMCFCFLFEANKWKLPFSVSFEYTDIRTIYCIHIYIYI
jgi:hypothetical protein